MMLGCALVAEDVEVLDDDAVDEAARRDEADADGEFEDGREIIAGLVHRREDAVQAVHDDADDDEPRVRQHTPLLIGERAEDDDERDDDAQHHFQAVQVALHRTEEDIAPFIMHRDVHDLHDEVDGHDGAADARELAHDVGIDLVAVVPPRKVALNADHRRADEERRNQEVERQDWAPPQREHLALRNQEQAAERRLMHHRENQADDDEHGQDFQNVGVQPFEHALRDDLVEFERQDRRVNRDAPEDLEQHGRIAPRDKRPPEMRPEADVEEQPRHDEDVAEERREERAPRDDTVFLHLETADEERRRIAAARERNAAEHVE